MPFELVKIMSVIFIYVMRHGVSEVGNIVVHRNRINNPFWLDCSFLDNLSFYDCFFRWILSLAELVQACYSLLK